MIRKKLIAFALCTPPKLVLQIVYIAYVCPVDCLYCVCLSCRLFILRILVYIAFILRILVYIAYTCLYCVYLFILRILVYIAYICLYCVYLFILRILVYIAHTCLYCVYLFLAGRDWDCLQSLTFKLLVYQNIM